MKRRRLRKKIWICNDVWMDIIPFFERVELGLKMALLSPRFNSLVDTHFVGKSELTIWKLILISKEDKGPKAELSVLIADKFVDFPFPDRPSPIKIRFKNLRINYIDHSVLAFLHANKQIWDRMGTKLEFIVPSYETEDVHPIWDFVISEIWPIFVTNIHHLRFTNANALANFRRRSSSTFLTDLCQLNSIDSDGLLPDVIADDGPNATAGQALSKWLHKPRKDRQPKRLRCHYYLNPPILEWINNFKEAFLRATISSSYIIQLKNFL